MSDDLVKMLKEDEGRDVCKEMADVFPCSSNCPCALELRVLADSDELDRLRAENARMMEALGLLDGQLDNHGFSADGPMRRLISRTLTAIQDKGGE